MPADVTARHWSRPPAAQLLAFIESSASHGLDPATYAPHRLRAAIQSGDAALLERQATETFGLIARDLSEGRVRPAQRAQFYIAAPILTPGDAARLIDFAISRGDVAGTLEALAPQGGQYAALRAALAALPADSQAERHKIEASLERLRWMPREASRRYVLVNIPEYRLRLLEDGAEIASHRIIVGKPQTPTPQFTTTVSGVIFNPPWNVPQSIVAESVGRLVRTNPAAARARGYTWRTEGGRLQVTQRPGPQNALGQMKLDMPNPFTVFIHDTANRELFAQPERALSHGCIRTEEPFALARRLLDDAGWTPAMIDETVTGGKTTRVALAAPLAVYAVYLTAYARPDGTVGYFGDPYALDAGVVSQLHGPPAG